MLELLKEQLKMLTKQPFFLLASGAVVTVGLIFGGWWLFITPRQQSEQLAVISSEKIAKQSEPSATTTQATTSSQITTTNQSSQSAASSEVVVDVKGQVKHPGVYTVSANTRIQGIIQTAGGLNDKADVSALNLAQTVSDQSVVYVPKKGEKIPNQFAQSNTGNQSLASSSQQSTSATTAGSNSNGKVNLNTASKSDLMQLNGIGEKKAEQIIAHRDQNGQFKQIEQLKDVSGIGEKTFDQLKDAICVE